MKMSKKWTNAKEPDLREPVLYLMIMGTRSRDWATWLEYRKTRPICGVAPNYCVFLNEMVIENTTVRLYGRIAAYPDWFFRAISEAGFKNWKVGKTNING